MFEMGPHAGRIETILLSQIDAEVTEAPIQQQPALQEITAQAKQVAQRFVAFVGKARQTIDICIYDFRLDIEEIQSAVVGAINAAAERGVAVRVAYDKNETGDEPILKLFRGAGGDPAPTGTDKFLREHAGLHPAVEVQPIAEEPVDPGSQIMHNKYMVRDAGSEHAAVWMGSANFTVDAWALQDNNIVVLDDSPDVAGEYEQDFEDLWKAGAIKGTGQGLFDPAGVGGLQVRYGFAPGEGANVQQLVADTINAAGQRVRVASMVLSSGPILEALKAKIDAGIDVKGVYDFHETDQVRKVFAQHPNDAAKLVLLEEVVAHLVAKNSLKFDNNSPGNAHNFMHNKLVVADGTMLTGSFNFSTNATRNAENVICLSNQALADGYAAYVDGLVKRYGAANAG